MNALMDLTARAVSFITAIQTTLLKCSIDTGGKLSILNIEPADFTDIFSDFVFKKEESSNNGAKDKEDEFGMRAVELVWVSHKPIDTTFAKQYTISISNDLVQWIRDNKEKGITAMKEAKKLYPAPFDWRETIKKILCNDPGERVNLARKLQYLPIQIILALGAGGRNAHTQRILQIWNVDENDKKKLLADDEIELCNKLSVFHNEANVEPLLREQETLYRSLVAEEVPLSFDDVLGKELEEIRLNRIARKKEQTITGNDNLPNLDEHPASIDPFQEAKDMQVCALCLSGGGIRSAIFNLGILQGLAQKNLLHHFDYLSTVSGGGYIGSWLAAWIKRDGSLAKVKNRLCPDKSPNPLGEELRPIRWLRMFSNYFAPNATLMSVDAWTVGITWLRNTLLNQIVIFLMLLSVLFCGELFFDFWRSHIQETIRTSEISIFYLSLIFLVPVAFLAGLGMHAYHSENFSGLNIKKEQTKKISIAILVIAFTAAYVLSGWFAARWNIETNLCPTLAATFCKMKVLWPAAAVTLAALLIVAHYGRYVDCIESFGNDLWRARGILFLTAAITTIVGLLALVFAWTIFQAINDSENDYIQTYQDQIEFILGLPIMLEVFSITVVTRMAFLGKYFPDERREWWGRMGGYVHRFSFLWIVICASALLGEKFLIHSVPLAIAAAGGWAVLVGGAVKAAFSLKPRSDGQKSTLSSFLGIFSKVGPYIFIIGLLVFLPALIKPLTELQTKIISDLHLPESAPEIKDLIIVIVCALAAGLLAWRIGVNEFTMHHFYRNRLVRAFLGGTRRDTERRRTSNPFTGFDLKDDERLYKLQHNFNYNGPYPVLNAALNASQVVDLDRQDRKAESFIFSPLFCGFDFSMIKASADEKLKSYDYAYRQTEFYAFPHGGPNIGTAMAISGAAINPNRGSQSSASTAFLLTVFNVQMGWWMGNPRQETWKNFEPKFGIGYIINNLLGKTNTRNNYVALSDGGHFDNMGLYEMIRRRCSFIVVCDAEQDEKFTCEGFANSIRRCRIDFGAEIDIDVSKIVKRKDGRFSGVHYVTGTIRYAGDEKPSAEIIYIKSSIVGDEPVDIFEYAVKNPAFPHQSTADQFFDEEQFESYRKLGLYIAGTVFEEVDLIDRRKNVKEGKIEAKRKKHNINISFMMTE